MKITIFGKDKNEIEKTAKEIGFDIVENNADIVASFGGDGTLVLSESFYPDIPKVALKNSMICKKCSVFSNEDVLKKIFNKEYSEEELMKISVQSKGVELFGINDITVHNKDPRHAIRYRLEINGEDLGHEIIGDGIIVSTPFGSTGYFRSITKSFFDVGVGLAFNNSTEQFDHMILKEDSIIKMKITRGPAIIYVDNQEKNIELDVNDEIIIKKSKHVAKILNPRID